MKTTIETNLETTIAYCEAKGLAKCFDAYAENCAGEDIMSVGFNQNSGYTYIALENGVSICSMLGRDIEYLISDAETGEETFCDTYKEAIAPCMSDLDENGDINF